MGLLNIATVVIFDKSKSSILLLHRSKPPYTGYWGFPGGKIEKGEQISIASRREIYEETKIELDSIELKAIVNELVHHESTIDSHFVLFYSVAETSQRMEDVSQSNEGELRWFNVNNLPEKMIPSDAKFISEWLGGELRELTFKECEIEITCEGDNISLNLIGWS